MSRPADSAAPNTPPPGASSTGASSTGASSTGTSSTGAAKASKRSGALAIAGVAVSMLYLVNPTAGVFELIPDVIPVVGNLDEVFFTGLLLTSLARLGITLPGTRAATPDDRVINVPPRESK